MEKKIYSPMERNMISGAKLLQKLNEALKADLLLLDLEKSVGLMDGLPLPGAEMEGGANGQ